MNKAGGDDGIPVELFQILKDIAMKVLHSVCQQMWKPQQRPQDWKRSAFIPIPKKGSAKECSNYCTIALISHASKIMLKILQVNFNRMWTINFQMFKLDLEKAEEPEIKLPTSAEWYKKTIEFQKNIYICFIDYAKAFDCVDHHKLWKILKEMGIPDRLTCLLRNLYAGQEVTVRTGYGTTDCFQVGKGVRQGCILSPCLFNLQAEYIMRNAGLDEAQLESRLPGEISITSDMQMTPPLWQKVKKN